MIHKEELIKKISKMSQQEKIKYLTKLQADLLKKQEYLRRQRDITKRTLRRSFWFSL